MAVVLTRGGKCGVWLWWPEEAAEFSLHADRHKKHEPSAAIWPYYKPFCEYFDMILGVVRE